MIGVEWLVLLLVLLAGFVLMVVWIIRQIRKAAKRGGQVAAGVPAPHQHDQWCVGHMVPNWPEVVAWSCSDGVFRNPWAGVPGERAEVLSAAAEKIRAALLEAQRKGTLGQRPLAY